MVQILIVDDHPIMCAGMSQIVKNYLPDAEFTLVNTLYMAIDEAGQMKYDLVIMAIAIPGGNSVQMVRKFRKHFPMTRLLIFSAYDETTYAIPYVKAGANGYISKRATELEFHTAIETVLMRNRVYLSDDVRDITLNTYIRPTGAFMNPIEQLSIRQKEILQLFYLRKRASEIAAILNLSTSTVNTHRIRIFRRLGVDNMYDLIQKFEMFNDQVGKSATARLH